MTSDVLIIGGGVIGLTLARELRRRGIREITIVDRGPVGREASWAAAGMLAPNIETDMTEEFHLFGCQSLELYPAFADALYDETGIDIELDRTGTLCIALSDAEIAALDEAYFRQKERNVRVQYLSAAAVRELEPAISGAVVGGLLYPNDWQVDNRKLVEGLHAFADRNDVKVIENAEITDLMTDGHRLTGAKIGDDDIAAGVTVIATGAWTSLIKIAGATLAVDVRPIRGQMISYEAPAGLLCHVVYGADGYLVPRYDGRILVGATVEDAGFEKVTTEAGVRALGSAAAAMAPVIAGYPIKEAWSGLRPFAPDGMPVLGRIPDYENLFVASAHYRNGILLAPKTAQIMADIMIEDLESPFLTSFGAERFVQTADAIRY